MPPVVEGGISFSHCQHSGQGKLRFARRMVLSCSELIEITSLRSARDRTKGSLCVALGQWLFLGATVDLARSCASRNCGNRAGLLPHPMLYQLNDRQ